MAYRFNLTISDELKRDGLEIAKQYRKPLSGVVADALAFYVKYVREQQRLELEKAELIAKAKRDEREGKRSSKFGSLSMPGSALPTLRPIGGSGGNAPQRQPVDDLYDSLALAVHNAADKELGIREAVKKIKVFSPLLSGSDEDIIANINRRLDDMAETQAPAATRTSTNTSPKNEKRARTVTRIHDEKTDVVIDVDVPTFGDSPDDDE